MLQGVGAGFFRSLQRRCSVRRAVTVTSQGPAGSTKNTMTRPRASGSPALRMCAVSWQGSAQCELCEGMSASAMPQRLRPMGSIIALASPGSRLRRPGTITRNRGKRSMDGTVCADRLFCGSPLSGGRGSLMPRSRMPRTANKKRGTEQMLARTVVPGRAHSARDEGIAESAPSAGAAGAPVRRSRSTIRRLKAVFAFS